MARASRRAISRAWLPETIEQSKMIFVTTVAAPVWHWGDLHENSCKTAPSSQDVIAMTNLWLAQSTRGSEQFFGLQLQGLAARSIWNRFRDARGAIKHAPYPLTCSRVDPR